MKKTRIKGILCLLLALMMTALLAGCGNGEVEEVATEVEEVEEIIEEVVEEPEEVEELEIEPEVEEEPEIEEIEVPEEEEEEEEELSGIYILVGDWVREDDPGIHYTFEIDGTGTRNTPGLEGGFEWLPVGDSETSVRLSSKEVSGVHGQEIWIFEMEGDVLVARKSTTNDERNHVEFRYVRVEP